MANDQKNYKFEYLAEMKFKGGAEENQKYVLWSDVKNFINIMGAWFRADASKDIYKLIEHEDDNGSIWRLGLSINNEMQRDNIVVQSCEFKEQQSRTLVNFVSNFYSVKYHEDEFKVQKYQLHGKMHKEGQSELCVLLKKDVLELLQQIFINLKLQRVDEVLHLHKDSAGNLKFYASEYSMDSQSGIDQAIKFEFYSFYENFRSSLQQRLKQTIRVKFTEQEILDLILSILQTLTVIKRELYIYHQDIDPNNIVLLPNGKYKITNFWKATNNFGENSTLVKNFQSKQKYKAPELKVVNQDKINLFKCDIYSLGYVFLECMYCRLITEYKIIEKRENIEKRIQYSDYIIELVKGMLVQEHQIRLDYSEIMNFLNSFQIVKNNISINLDNFNTEQQSNENGECTILIRLNDNQQIIILLNNAEISLEYLQQNSILNGTNVLIDLSEDNNITFEQWITLFTSLLNLKIISLDINIGKIEYNDENELITKGFQNLNNEFLVKLDNLILNNNNILHTLKIIAPQPNSLTQVSFNSLFSSINKCTNLVKLYLDLYISDDIQIHTPLTNLELLEEFSFKLSLNQGFSTDSIINVLQWMQNNDDLQLFKLEFNNNNTMTDPLLKFLKQCLHHQIVQINIIFTENEQFSSESLTTFMDELKKCEIMKHLYLDFSMNQNVNDQTIQALAYSIQTNNIQHFQLMIGNNETITDSSMSTLIQKLCQSGKLEYIIIYCQSNMNLTDLIFYSMKFRNLKELKVLELNFYYNTNISDHGFNVLIKELSQGNQNQLESIEVDVTDSRVSLNSRNMFDSLCKKILQSTNHQ